MLLLLYDCCLANLITSSNHIFLWQHRTIPALRLKHRSGSCGTASALPKMLDNVGLRYPHRASGAKAPRTLRPLPLLRFAVSATGGAHFCSIQYYLRFWLSICRTSLAVSALRIMRYCHWYQYTTRIVQAARLQTMCGRLFGGQKTNILKFTRRSVIISPKWRWL